jgi:hypothetical protein
MAKLDLVLMIVFGTVSLTSLGAAVWCFRKALKVSGEKEGDVRMIAWVLATLFGLVVSGMCAAYILLPIIVP